MSACRVADRHDEAGPRAARPAAGRRCRALLRRLACSAMLSNWPFALKMAFCPGLAVIGIVGMGLYGLLAATQQTKLIHAVVRHDLAVAVQLSQDATRLQEIEGLLYRLTTLRASQAPDLDVAGETARLAAKAGSLADELQRQGDGLDSDQDRDQLRRLVAEVRLYHDAIEVFGSMLELDFASAVGFIRPFDANAGKVLDLIDAIAGRAIRGASSRALASAALAERIRPAMAAIALASSLLLFSIAALLTRTTVRSVRRIADATDRVARGAEIDVGALARGDELGVIVQSLAVFQANVSQIAFLAHHDPLTRLPNRVLFHDRVQQALSRAGRDAGCAVLCLDLDRFKAVNDTLGHPVGDALLRQVAERLQGCVRDGDTVARLGGDEFAIVLLDVAGPAEIGGLAERIIEAIGASFEIDGHQVGIGTSIGVSLAQADGATSHDLLKNADIALYGAKANGRGTVCFHEDAMNVALQSRRMLEMSLRQAIAREELQLHYQPLVDSRSHLVCGFEALIRWQHPEHGTIQPDTFISVAESSGLIGAIGRWVLRRACLDAATWPDDIKVAVNLSPLQFRGGGLVADIRDALAASGLAAERLEVEVTESVLLHDSIAILEILRRIKALRVTISMDDFGTGYSSLSYLRSFPFDKVKIDRSFIRDLPDDRNAVAIVRAIVGLIPAALSIDLSASKAGLCPDPPKARGLWKPLPLASGFQRFAFGGV